MGETVFKVGDAVTIIAFDAIEGNCALDREFRSYAGIGADAWDEHAGRKLTVAAIDEGTDWYRLRGFRGDPIARYLFWPKDGVVAYTEGAANG